MPKPKSIHGMPIVARESEAYAWSMMSIRERLWNTPLAFTGRYVNRSGSAKVARATASYMSAGRLVGGAS